MTSARRRAAATVVAVAAGLASVACAPERPELIAVNNVPAEPTEPTETVESRRPTRGPEPTTTSDGAASTVEDDETADSTQELPATVQPAATPEPPATAAPAATAEAAAPAEPTATPETTATAAPTATPENAASDARAAAPNGRRAPMVATDSAGLAAQIIEAETTLRDPASSPEALAAAGHLQQVTYRKLGREDDWDATLLPLIPDELRPTVELHITARRSLRGLASGFATADFIPAWDIGEPESAENLMAYYREASEDSGIDWEYLAAINLIETGMGRINGLSGSGAQGPMQFMPTTWDEVGEGDVFDPHDAIVAAARYLVRRGGPDDMPKALWGYNNSDEYVASVSTYAQILREDPDAFLGLYHWQIYFWTDAGDVWLPSGYRSTSTIDVDEYLAAAPWSEPDPGLG